MFGWFTRFLKSTRGTRQQFGYKGEAEAARYLEGLGYKILHWQLRGRYRSRSSDGIDHTGQTR